MSLATAAVSALGHLIPGSGGGRLLILIYHRVRPRPDPMFPGEVDAERFDWQMALLRRHCRPIALAEAVASLRKGSLPARAVAVTFDDGYADNATIALPILQRHAVPATFFVAPGFLDGGRMWNDTIIEAIRCAPGSTLDLGEFGLGDVPLGPEATRGAIAQAALRKIKHLPPADRLALADRFGVLVGRRLPTDLMMTSGQVRQLADAGMEVGAHTMTHPILRAIAAQQARQEIDDSRKALEAITGRSVTAFAYPNGRPDEDYTVRDRDLVRDLGFHYAVATLAGTASAGSDIFQLPRFTPWDRTPERWLVRLLLAFRRTVDLARAAV